MMDIVTAVVPMMQELFAAFTLPTQKTMAEIFFGWVMCLGRHSEFRAFDAINPAEPVDRSRPHPFHRFYNFFSRSSWRTVELSKLILIAIVTRLAKNQTIYLTVDDTLLHKIGKNVYGLGWFRDAVRSTKRRVVTAPGNHWVVMAIILPIPMTGRMFALPICAELHLAGKGTPGEPELSLAMIERVVAWLGDREIVLIGDGAYASNKLLKTSVFASTVDDDGDTIRAADFVGRIRSDAKIFDPTPPRRPKNRRGVLPKKGPQLPKPREIVALANSQAKCHRKWKWEEVEATTYGQTETFWVCTFVAVWPRVLGLERIRVAVVCDSEDEVNYFFTTRVDADAKWIIESYARRWAIEVSFRDSKQSMGIEHPRHWCRSSVEKIGPWVWLMQSVIAFWYWTTGHETDEAEMFRARLGPLDNEWSHSNMLRVLRFTLLHKTFRYNSSKRAELLQIIQSLENYLSLAA